MSTIYVLSTGEYSDYNIQAVTTNKEVAEAYSKIHGCYIEEYPDLEDGNTIIAESKKYYPYIRVYVSSDGVIMHESYIKERLNRRYSWDFSWFKDDDMISAPRLEASYKGGYTFDMYVYTPETCTFEKLQKIVMDTRAKMLAERLGL